MRPHQPARDDYNIMEICSLVRSQSRIYHNRVRLLRKKQAKYGFADDIYFEILKKIRTEIFTKLHAGLRGLYSARITRRFFRPISLLTINERSHSWDPSSPLANRYVLGIVEGLWDIIFTETGNSEFETS